MGLQPTKTINLGAPLLAEFARSGDFLNSGTMGSWRNHAEIYYGEYRILRTAGGQRKAVSQTAETETGEVALMLDRKILLSPGCSKKLSAKCRYFSKYGLLCVPAVLSLLWTTSLAAQADEGAAAPQPSAPPNAAPVPQATPAHPMHSAHRRPTLDDRVKALSKALDLSEPQQAAVKGILEQRQAEILRLRQDGSISGAERIDRLRALQDQTVLRIRAVLNDDQKKKYDPLAVRDRTPAPDQRTIEDWLKETTPKPAPPQHP